MENVICIYMHLGNNHEIYCLVVTQMEPEGNFLVPLICIFGSKVRLLRNGNAKKVKV